MIDADDMAGEYARIKDYCRGEAAKSFKHPMAPKEEMPSEPMPAEESAEMSDEELEALLSEG